MERNKFRNIYLAWIPTTKPKTRIEPASLVESFNIGYDNKINLLLLYIGEKMYIILGNTNLGESVLYSKTNIFFQSSIMSAH